jgi:MFS family permease
VTEGQSDSPAISAPIRLGLGANLGQFALLVAVSALVGGMVGQERTVLPLLATDVFGLTGFVSALTFVVAFGVAKAFTNLAAGALADRFGRKPVLVAGWLIGLPVPILIILAPSWGWIVLANLLLGVNQGLTWSTTVIMKIDLVGPVRRGLATGINEAAGYGAVRVHGPHHGMDRGRVRPPSGSLPCRAGVRMPWSRCVGPVRA